MVPPSTASSAPTTAASRRATAGSAACARTATACSTPWSTAARSRRRSIPSRRSRSFTSCPARCTYSLATVGCNFTCAFCQNAEISQMPRDRGRVVGTPLSPDEVVEAALQSGCRSISYTYTEPTIFYEYARDCARRLRSRAQERLRHQRLHDARDAATTSTATCTPPTSISSPSPTTSTARWSAPGSSRCSTPSAGCGRWGSGWR